MNPEQEHDQCESDVDGFPVGSPDSPVLEDPDCDGCREEFGAPSNCVHCPYRDHPKAKPTPCSHPPGEQYQVQADITDDTVDPGFYCRLCRKKVSEYGPTEEAKKSWPPRDANELTDQQKYPVIEEPEKELMKDCRVRIPHGDVTKKPEKEES